VLGKAALGQCRFVALTIGEENLPDTQVFITKQGKLTSTSKQVQNSTFPFKHLSFPSPFQIQLRRAPGGTAAGNTALPT